ncbi:MAG: LuxR C-terminal-related transcriptional regulator [Vicinamibacterales bacterium]
MTELLDRRTVAWAVLTAAAGLLFFLLLEWREDPSLTLGGLLVEALELIPVVAATAGVVLLFRTAARQREDQLALLRELEIARLQGQRWRSEARALLNGLGDAIDVQFTRWNLTDAEREVALLLLKGLTLREIAGVRAAAERTIRAQAQAVYAKAGVTGRASLSAFFLEDLLAPIGRADTTSPT